MPDSGLPDGWRGARLGEVATIETGGTPSRAKPEFWGGTVRWMSSGEVNQRRVASTAEFITEAGVASSNAKVFPPGTLMLAMNGQGSTRGKVAVLEVEAACNQSLAAIRGKNGVDSRFLLHNIDSRYDELRNLTGGDARSGLNLGLIRGFRLNVPPPDEQRRIAEVLDAIDAAIGKTEAVIAATERLRSALLGELLTRGVPGWHTEWKQAPGIGTIPACWEVVTIGTLGPPGGDVVLTGPFGAELRSADFTKVGVPVLNIGNVQEDGLHTDKLDHVGDETARRLARYRVRTGDLLFSRMATVGRATTVPASYDGALISYHLMRLRLDDALASSELVMYCIQGLPTVQRQIADMSGGGTRLGVNSTALRSLRVPLPSRLEQEQIVKLLSGVRYRMVYEQIAIDRLSDLKRTVANALLSGRVRVGAR
jgi:type I restriction enzyme S subunit